MSTIGIGSSHTGLARLPCHGWDADAVWTARTWPGLPYAWRSSAALSSSLSPCWRLRPRRLPAGAGGRAALPGPSPDQSLQPLLRPGHDRRASRSTSCASRTPSGMSAKGGWNSRATPTRTAATSSTRTSTTARPAAPRVIRETAGIDVIYHPSHFHFHLANFASYLLLKRDASGTYQPTSADGTKTSFCIIDYARLSGGGSAAARYTSCSEHPAGTLGRLGRHLRRFPARTMGRDRDLAPRRTAPTRSSRRSTR